MSVMSEVLLRTWQEQTLVHFGRELPLNYIAYDLDSRTGEIGHLVPDTDEPLPLPLPDSSPVRLFTVTYLLDDIQFEDCI